MNEILIGLAGAIGIPLFGFTWGLFMKPKKVKGWGVRLGKLASALGQKKVGRKGWEKIEKRFQGTLSDFMEGIQEGLDADDKLRK